MCKLCDIIGIKTIRLRPGTSKLQVIVDELNTEDVCLQLIYFNLEGKKREQIKEDS